MCTQAVVTNAWFCVYNILEKNKELQMDFFHIILFSMYWYIYSKSLKLI